VCGYKPTHGLVSRRGVLLESRPLDHVGFFARTVEDLALLAEPLMAYDASDPDMRPRARPGLMAMARTAPPVTPRIAFVKTPVWDQAEAQLHAAFAELVAALGQHVEEIALPPAFDAAHDMHRTIMEADLALNFAGEYARGRDQLSPRLREMIERGGRVLAVDYHRAVAGGVALAAELDELLWAYDVILTPATTGEAPKGLDSTGSPAFCTIWTLCGVPAVTLPLLQGEAGMPIGVQLIGKNGEDAKLLRTARWLAGAVTAPKARPRKRT
jgi:Asp-tRNA(Asn)/Glu-tRNA(Gln) amidotransferase A subunit family amidase